jgi:hypothetical protein
MKILPIPMFEILPVAVLATALSGCHATTAVEASSTRNPVVAPAGSVLRVRLNESLETGRSRPGDRFSGVLDSALLADAGQVLPKGTSVEGRVLAAREPVGQTRQRTERAVLAVTLEDFKIGENRFPIAANVVTRTAPGAGPRGTRHVKLEADSIIGFTLTGIISN